MSSAYIVDGRVERGGSTSRLGVRTHFLQYLLWNRVLFLLGVAALFIVTNPANSHLLENDTTPSYSQPTMMSYFSSLIWGQDEQGITNYLFFSVKDSYDALVFMALRESWACRYDDMDIGFVCDLLRPVLNHGKPVLWDESDPVHTAHRMLCWLLIFSAAASFCCPNPYDGRLFDNPFFDSLFSVFYRPHLLSDLFHESLTVYPALVELHNILPRLRSDSMWSTGDANLDFAVAVMLFVLGIGGGSNFIASQILPKNSPHCITGFSPVVAASMAYCHRIRVLGPLVLFRLDVLSVNTSDLYWTELALIFLRGTRNTFPTMVAWLVAGLLGTALAKYQLENLVIWGGFYKLFG